MRALRYPRGSAQFDQVDSENGPRTNCAKKLRGAYRNKPSAAQFARGIGLELCKLRGDRFRAVPRGSRSSSPSARARAINSDAPLVCAPAFAADRLGSLTGRAPQRPLDAPHRGRASGRGAVCPRPVRSCAVDLFRAPDRSSGLRVRDVDPSPARSVAARLQRCKSLFPQVAFQPSEHAVLA